MNGYQTPILLLVFNRMSTTIAVFEEIKKVKPRFLFIASDGARTSHDETNKVLDVRNYLLASIDWECDLKTLFREDNLGCGEAPYNAITWFFNNVEQGIILEDDCLPLPGFFYFCEKMLNHYKNDETVYEICGHNLQAGKIRGDGSYYFSNYGGIWGWATWRRAWEKYDYYMSDFNEASAMKLLKNKFAEKEQWKYWSKMLYKASKLGSWWDYQWLYTIWKNNGRCIVPNANLVNNIGFEGTGTHTTQEPKWYKKLTSTKFNIVPIQHPSSHSVDFSADNFQFSKTISAGLLVKVASFIKVYFK